MTRRSVGSSPRRSTQREHFVDCRYRTGASARASSTIGWRNRGRIRDDGGGEGCVRGSAGRTSTHRPVRTATRSSIRKTMPHCALGPLRVTFVKASRAPQYVPGLYEIILEGIMGSRTGYV